MTAPLLRVESLSKHFPVTRGVLGRVHGQLRAVDDVSFQLFPGETVGLVGESGCGKSTVGRTLLRLYKPTSGTVWFEGRNLEELTRDELQQTRRNMQIVFQDPYSSLNPRMRVFDIVGEALQVHGVAKGDELRRRVFSLLEQVGVSARWADRYAHEFSGGQRQRIGIARAIALNPKLLVCDEAVSALDVSIQAQIINLLIELRERLGLAYLFISHDLSVVRHISHRVMVMYLGQVVELGPTREIFDQAAHPYTRALLSAVPSADPRRRPERVVLHGDVPSPLNPPSGCRFHTRCPAVFERCSVDAPGLYTLGTSRRTVRCFHAEGLEEVPDWHAQLERRLLDAQRRHNAGSKDEADRRELEEERVGVSEPAPGEDPPWATETWSLEGADSASGSRGEGASPGGGAPSLARRMTLLTLLGCALLGALLLAVGVARTAQTQRELQALASELEGYRATTGQYPASLGELGYRLGFVFGTRRAVDPWGSPYQYGQEPNQATVELWSNGADRTPGTRDDVRLSSPVAGAGATVGSETR